MNKYKNKQNTIILYKTIYWQYSFLEEDREAASAIQNWSTEIKKFFSHNFWQLIPVTSLVNMIVQIYKLTWIAVSFH